MMLATAATTAINTPAGTPACELCGWIAAVGSMIGFGSFGAPVKSRTVEALDIDPLVFQTYKTAVCFVTSWLVIALGVEQFTFTPWGIVSAAFWVPGGVGTIYAIKYAGLAVGVGLGSSCIVLVSFIWGVVIFDEHVHNIYAASFAILCIMAGILGMSYYSSPESASTVMLLDEENDDGHDGHDDDTVMMDLALSSSSPISPPPPAGLRQLRSLLGGVLYRGLETQEEEEEDDSGCLDDDDNDRGRATATPATTTTAILNEETQSPRRRQRGCLVETDAPCNHQNSATTATAAQQQQQHPTPPVTDVGDNMTTTATATTIEHQHHHQHDTTTTASVTCCGIKLTRRQSGLVVAIVAGCWGGSILAPMKVCKRDTKGVGYLISFAIGAAIITCSFWLARYLYLVLYCWYQSPTVSAYQQLPSFHFRVMWLPGGMAGLLWSFGNLCSLMSVYYLGEGVGYPLSQTAILVSGLWGIFYFKEIKGTTRILKWFAASLLTIFGILLLSYEHHEK